MRYLLDTDICIHIIKRAPEHVFKRLERLRVGDVGVSAITVCELQFGVSNSLQPEKNQRALTEFLGPIEVLDFPAGASAVYGNIRRHLQRAGTLIGNYDLLIAAHAIYRALTLVSNNTKEFRRVPGLQVENWIQPEKTMKR